MIFFAHLVPQTILYMLSCYYYKSSLYCGNNVLYRDTTDFFFFLLKDKEMTVE